MDLGTGCDGDSVYRNGIESNLQFFETCQLVYIYILYKLLKATDKVVFQEHNYKHISSEITY